jgi:hypothetical protein
MPEIINLNCVDGKNLAVKKGNNFTSMDNWLYSNGKWTNAFNYKGEDNSDWRFKSKADIIKAIKKMRKLL